MTPTNRRSPSTSKASARTANLAIAVIGPGGNVTSGVLAFDMGAKESGGTLTATFTIENTGTGDLTVSAITEPSPVFSIASAPAAPIPPGGSDDFRVRFQPHGGGRIFPPQSRSRAMRSTRRSSP
ncbi:MAG: DUF1573 domain-containing protein [Verrucomicrobiales bacterium]